MFDRSVAGTSRGTNVPVPNPIVLLQGQLAENLSRPCLARQEGLAVQPESGLPVWQITEEIHNSTSIGVLARGQSGSEILRHILFLAQSGGSIPGGIVMLGANADWMCDLKANEEDFPPLLLIYNADYPEVEQQAAVARRLRRNGWDCMLEIMSDPADVDDELAWFFGRNLTPVFPKIF